MSATTPLSTDEARRPTSSIEIGVVVHVIAGVIGTRTAQWPSQPDEGPQIAFPG